MTVLIKQPLLRRVWLEGQMIAVIPFHNISLHSTAFANLSMSFASVQIGILEFRVRHAADLGRP